MAFQIKSFVSIVASMLNRLLSVQATVTDFSVGSVARTILEAPSQEIDELYQMMVAGLLEAIPTSVYASFSFPALAATPTTATFTIQITVQPTDTTIPSSTVFTPQNGGSVTYISTNTVTIPAGQTVGNIPIAAQIAGAAGNVAAGTTFTVSPQPPGFVSANSPAAAVNGSDAETAGQHKLRFNSYIVTLSRGTIAAVIYGSTLGVVRDINGNVVEKVQFARVVEPWLADTTQPVGFFYLYIHNGVGSTSSALVTTVQTIIDGSYDSSGNPIPGYKAAGVKAVVVAASETVVNVTATLSAATGYDKPTLVNLASQAIFAYILGLTLGQSCILAQITDIVMNIPGVANFVIAAPSSDVTAAANVKLMPGTVTPT